MVIKVKLTRGKEAIVDNIDFRFVKSWKWHVDIQKRRNTVYATRTIRKNELVYKIIFGAKVPMHRWLMMCILEDEGRFEELNLFLKNPIEYQVDHIDGNGLNNTRNNLRLVNSRQNSQNIHRNTSSKYPGVYRQNNYKNPWCARIHIKGKSKYLGLYKTEKKAFEAYKKALYELTGEKVICELE